jgi:hypothetical protein
MPSPSPMAMACRKALPSTKPQCGATRTAAKGGHGSVVRILLAAGADKTILGGLGNNRTALDFAHCSYSGTCKHLLALATDPTPPKL